MKKIELSLVLPCYNEAEHFNTSALRILTYLKELRISFEIIFVEDKSTDITKNLIELFINKYPRENISALFHGHNRGRGTSVMDGIQAARGEKVGFIDIDLEIDCTYIPQFLEALHNGYDVVCANRTYKLKFQTLVRFLTSVVYKYISRMILGTPLQDTEAGYKFFSKKKIIPLFPLVINAGWFWDTEIMVRSWKEGLRIKEIPVVFNRRTDKTSTVRLIPDTIDYIKNLYHFEKTFSRPLHSLTSHYWNHEASRWDKLYFYRHFSPTTFFLYRRHVAFAPIIEQFKGKKVLDVGCGNGVFMIEVIKNQGRVVGVDYSKNMLKVAQERLRPYSQKTYQLINGSATRLPFKKSSFDGLIASGLTDYLSKKDNGKFLKEASRVLKKKGVIAVTFPSLDSPFAFLRSGFGLWLRDKLFSLPPIMSTFAKIEIEKIMKDAGFSITRFQKVLGTMYLVEGIKK